MLRKKCSPSCRVKIVERKSARAAVKPAMTTKPKPERTARISMTLNVSANSRMDTAIAENEINAPVIHRTTRMSNCHLVAGRSLIDLVASRLALRAPALRAATALTRPNRSAQRLPCGRRTAPTAVTVDPSRTVAEHGVERGDHLTHHRHDDDLRLLSGGLEAIVACFACRIPITSAQRGHVEHVADARATTPDATASFELAAIEVIGRKPDESGTCLRLIWPSSGKSAISVQASTAPTPGMEVSSRKRWAGAGSAPPVASRAVGVIQDPRSCSISSAEPAASLLTGEHCSSGNTVMSKRSFEKSIPPKDSISIFVSLPC